MKHNVKMLVGGVCLVAFVGISVCLPTRGVGHSGILSNAEMSSRWGACPADCKIGNDEERTCDKSFEGCEESNCGLIDKISVGTDNTYMVCHDDDPLDGNCVDYGLVKCADEYYSEKDGSLMFDMKCSSVSWNCMAGDTSCVECVQGELVDPPYETWVHTYECVIR